MVKSSGFTSLLFYGICQLTQTIGPSTSVKMGWGLGILDRRGLSCLVKFIKAGEVSIKTGIFAQCVWSRTIWAWPFLPLVRTLDWKRKKFHMWLQWTSMYCMPTCFYSPESEWSICFINSTHLKGIFYYCMSDERKSAYTIFCEFIFV